MSPRHHYHSAARPGEPGSPGNPIVCDLYVARSLLAPSASRPWRLLWAESVDSDTFTWAEGECSAMWFTTMSGAIRSGEKRFGITAQRYPVNQPGSTLV